MTGFQFGESITINRRVLSATPDAYGNDVYVDSPSTVVGAFAPGTTFERLGTGDTITTQPSLYLPSGTAVEGIDWVSVRGKKYEVDGDPGDWRSPFTGWHAGIVVPLKAVTG
jgi:hypothetical protein